MAWTVTFQPASEKETVGTVVATFNSGLAAEFVYVGSVNLGIDATIEDFAQQARKALAAFTSAAEDKALGYGGMVSSIEARLNSK